VRAPAKATVNVTATVIVIVTAARVLARLAGPAPVPLVLPAGVPAGPEFPARPGEAATVRTPVRMAAALAAPVLVARVPAVRAPAR
jgi:hypothetical protein